ncbi:tetratricopeptide repeat protein [Arachidicoccus soli]|uniref:YaiO beta-barrel domain-containing protein n=1 Tax=Arachidicoccus soli TaxID=2341117 RepID=A0A386HNI9_9BACT|nr:tetratricopeptide repeat protein [Arachidicoccus soli]AYD47199.1 hypothetical protein D6B99_05980 [Arachidicoccus soli]
MDLKQKKIFISTKELSKLVVTFISLFFFSYVSGQSTIELNSQNDYTKQIQASFDEGNWELGKSQIDAGLIKYPKDGDLRILSGKYYLHVKQYDKARYELKKSLELNPNNEDAKKILVNVETESKRYSSAICYINELLETAPYMRSLWVKKIDLYQLQGNLVEANHLQKRLSQIYPEDNNLHKDYVYSTEMEANKKRKEGKIDDVITLNKELVQQDPKNLDHYSTLANDFLKAGDQYNALAYIERGLNLFPGNIGLINKKASILAGQKRYDELLSFLQQEMKHNNSGSLQQSYNNYLLDAARNAKDKDPSTLYGKIFDRSPGNEEAFSYVFNSAVAKQQYEVALVTLNKFRKVHGDSKSLSLKELMVYNRMGNNAKAANLTKQLFAQYPNDTDLRSAYAKLMLEEAKARMKDESYKQAIIDWNLVRQYGDDEMNQIAQSGLYNAYYLMGDYNNALNALSDIIGDQGNNPELYIKRASIYQKQKRYHEALMAYEQAIKMSTDDQKQRYLGGYAEMLTLIIKSLNEKFHYDEAMQYVNEWLVQDSTNYDALHYAVNISNSMKKPELVHFYAQKGYDAYPDDVYFKIKLAEVKQLDAKNYPTVYTAMYNELKINPYNEDLINTFSQLTDDYSKQLIKETKSMEALSILDTALHYTPNSKSLKYTKGVAFEKLKKYDSAYYYQSFYEPSAMEVTDFKQHLFYLKYKGYDNEIGIYDLRSRDGSSDAISTISTMEYSKFSKGNTYVGRVNYAGRPTGKGIQIQGEWSKIWSQSLSSKFDLAWANKFFPSIVANASFYKEIKSLSDLEAELGIGYRRLSEPNNENLINLVIGATKEVDPWRINVRFNNFLLNGKWLYNLSSNIHYNLSSPKNYLIATGSIGSSPDAELIDYQFYNGFSVLNTMVGAGGGHMLTKTVSAGILGTWYNYSTGVGTNTYKNLYNIYLQLNVAF